MSTRKRSLIHDLILLPEPISCGDMLITNTNKITYKGVQIATGNVSNIYPSNGPLSPKAQIALAYFILTKNKDMIADSYVGSRDCFIDELTNVLDTLTAILDDCHSAT